MTEAASIRNGRLRDLILTLSTSEAWRVSLESGDTAIAGFDTAMLAGIRRVFVTGHGTSFATSQLIATWISHIGRVEATAVPSFAFSQYLDDHLFDPAATLVVGITCGGNTKSVVKSLAVAKECGAKTLVVTGRHQSDSVAMADLWLPTAADTEKSVDTPVYSVSHLYIAAGGYQLALALGEANGTLDGKSAAQWRADLDATLASLGMLPELFDDMAEIAKDQAGAAAICVLGTGPNLGTATEGALKISEFSWVFGAAEELEDFAHGRFREVDESVALFVIAPAGPAVAKTKDILVGCETSKTPAIVLTDVEDAAIERLSHRVVRMPQAPNEYLTPFLYIFPLWFFGWHRMNDNGGVVGEKRYGLLASDIDFVRYYDESGVRRSQNAR